MRLDGDATTKFQIICQIMKVSSTSESNTPTCIKSKIPHIFLKYLEGENDAANSDVAPGR